MNRTLAVLGTVLLLGAGPVGAEHGSAAVHGTAAPPSAAAGPEGPTETLRTLSDFRRLDADRNGSLALSELDADSDLGFNFWTYDRDGDGNVSRAEYNDYVLATVEDD